MCAVDYSNLQKLGAMMGSGGMVVMDERSCMVDVAQFFMEFLRNESCGKCSPCREGTTRMFEILHSVSERPVGDELKRLERFRGILHLEELAETVRETSLCGLGQSAANPVLSTLRFFRDEYEAHILENRCPAGRLPGPEDVPDRDGPLRGLHGVQEKMPQWSHCGREETGPLHRDRPLPRLRRLYRYLPAEGDFRGALKDENRRRPFQKNGMRANPP